MRYLLTALLWCFASIGMAQDTLTQDYFLRQNSNLLLIDLNRTDTVSASFHSNEAARPELQWSALPFELSSPSFSTAHPVLFLGQQDTAVFAYNRQPSVSGATELISFTVGPSLAEQDFNDQFAFAPPREGIFVFRNGLRYRIYYRSDPVNELEFESMVPIGVSQPDAVGFILPDGYEGRTISNSGSMFQPQPEALTPVVRFALSNQVVNQLAIDFSLPEPAWFQDVTDLLLKTIGVVLPVLLLILTKPKEVNRARYRVVAIILGVIILGIYSGLSLYAYSQGLGFRKIVENAVFAALTVGATYATYWVTSKNDASELE